MTIARKLTQQVTYWENLGTNSYGEEVLAAPVLLAARWHEEYQEIRTPSGEEVVSKAVVWTLEGLTVDGYLALGDLTNNVGHPSYLGAFQIRATAAIPSLRSNETEHKAFL